MNEKYYKLTLARIGKQESWAGWKIAGKSENTPSQIIESFESFHSSKNHVVSSLNKPVEMYEVAEYRGNLFVSNVRFGIKDMLGRPSFSVRGIAFPISDNPGLFKCPESFLKLTKEDFNFQLKRLYDSNRNLKQEYITGNNVVTIHDNRIINNRELSITKVIEKYFPEKEKLELFVRSIFWAGNNNQTTLCLKTPVGFNEYFEIMYLVYSILPLNMRSNFSFRTYNLRNLSGAKIVFDECIPFGKYFDIASGNNNIFTDTNVLNNSKKLSFVQYIIESINSDTNSEYFELLQETLDSMGQSQKTDLNTIEMAHNMMMSSKDEFDEELSDLDILKKFQEYISLDYSNDVVDENIVKYFSLILERGIKLNDTLLGKLEIKLKNTKYQPLIELGYEFKAANLIENKEKAFPFLFSIEDDDTVYPKYIKYILEYVGGPVFLDEYYATFYSKRKIRTIGDLCEFYLKTKDLPERTLIYKIVNDTATKYSLDLVDQMLENHIEFNYEDHIELLNNRLGLANTSQNITNEMKRQYWNRYSFMSFKFERINDYITYLPYENWKSNLIKGLKNVVDESYKQKPSTVKLFRSYLKGLNVRGIALTDEEQLYLKKLYQKFCLANLNKSISLDFWYEVSRLLSDKRHYDPFVIDFIFDNRIKVFTNPKLFKAEFETSEIYSNRFNDDGGMQTYYAFCQTFLQYIDDHAEYDELGRTLRHIQNKDKHHDIYSSSSGSNSHRKKASHNNAEQHEFGVTSLSSDNDETEGNHGNDSQNREKPVPFEEDEVQYITEYDERKSSLISGLKKGIKLIRGGKKDKRGKHRK